MMTASAARPGDVVVDLPADAPFARVARTAAVSCAVLEGFSVDQLGDVRLLVDEVFVAMIGLGVRRVRLRLVPDSGSLAVEVVGRRAGSVRRPSPDTRFVQMLADVVARDVTIDLEPPAPRFAATIIAG
jgi:hypothetical protein